MQVGKLQLSLQWTVLFGRKPPRPFAEVETLVTSTLFLATGNRRSYLSDPAFKQALLSAMHRSRIGRLAGSGRSEVAAGPVPRGLLDDRSKPPRHDREEASRLLNRLARRNPELREHAASGRVKLALLIDASRLDDRNVAGALVADLDRVGLSITIDARPAAEYERLLAARRHGLALLRRPIQTPLPRVAARRGGPPSWCGSCGARGSRPLRGEGYAFVTGSPGGIFGLRRGPAPPARARTGSSPPRRRDPARLAGPP